MTGRVMCFGLMALTVIGPPAWGQPGVPQPIADQHIDPVNGLSLEQAIAGARDNEPGLRAARTQVNVTEGMKVQAGLRPNPSVTFERRDEPGGTDSLTAVGVEWPLDLFRRSRRIAVADRELAAARFAVADRERLLEADVRTRYGEVLVTIRELQTLDELVITTWRQHELLRARVEEGASPRLERDLLEVEFKRLDAERLVQAGKVDVAVLELKRLLGRPSNEVVAVRETLESIVSREVAATLPGAAGTGVEQRSDVREAAARVDAADARIQRARAEGRIDVNAFANYMRMDAGFPQRGVALDGSLVRIREQFQYFSVGGSVTIPLLDRSQGDIAVARAERAGAAALYDAALLSAQSEQAAAQVRDLRARQAVQSYSGATVSLAAQNLAVVRQSHELGRMTLFDVLSEQRRFLDVQRAYTAALREAYEARTALLRSVGGLQ